MLSRIIHCSGFVFEIGVDQVLERGDAFDDFRDALQRHQREADRRSSLTGQRIKPPAFEEPSAIRQSPRTTAR